MVALFCAAIQSGDAQGVASFAADRARIAQITGSVDSTNQSFRPLGSLLSRVPRFSRLRLSVVEPDVRLTFNSQLPYSINDGPLWAGRGWSGAVSAGFTAERRFRGKAVRATVAPAVVYSQNLPFPLMPATFGDRSPYSSPFHGAVHSLDLPTRFGNEHIIAFDPGRSELRVTGSAVVFGLTATSETWGPGIRNALVMSGNAPGVPRAFIATAQPIRSRAGDVEARYFAGTLTESLYFDLLPENDWRSVSGWHVQLRPAFDTMFTIGLARIVYTPARPSVMGVVERSLGALTRWEYILALDDTLASGRTRQRSDQIIAASARWIAPDAGFEVYGEWARMELPRTLGELFVAPHHSAGYTIGFQWAQPRRQRDHLRLQSEFTYLEQNLAFADRPSPDFYAGRASRQGYTHRGQLVGAPIGPGGSSQWVALDYFTPAAQGGVFLGRIRWENDELYRQGAANFFRHDVSVLGGLRAGMRSRAADMHVELTWAYRYNYLFQNGYASPGGFRTVDMRNVTIALTAAPR